MECLYQGYKYEQMLECETLLFHDKEKVHS
nr:MAG TPA: hypothetical protein [Caudoviricetes sp.]